MQASSLIRSAYLGLLGSASLAFGSSVAFAEAPVRSTVVSYANGGGDQNGYSRASVGLNYKFIRCDNEIHLAYSLDNKSVRVSDTYSYNGKEIMAAQPAPTPPTIALSGSVTDGRSTTTIAQISDGLAAPALGYGCFSGQTKRVGPVPAGSPAQVDAYVSNLTFSPSDMPQVLRNGAIENTQATAERAEQQRLAAEKEKAEQTAARKDAEAQKRTVEAERKKAAALVDSNKAKAAAAREAATLGTAEADPGASTDRTSSAPASKTTLSARPSDPSAEQNEDGDGDYFFAACSWNELITPKFLVNATDLYSLRTKLDRIGDDADTLSIVGDHYKKRLSPVERWMTAVYVKKIWQTTKQGLYSPKLTWGARCRAARTEILVDIVIQEHNEGKTRSKMKSIELPWTLPDNSPHQLRTKSR